mmetsp:Transcript_3325/g.9630  ORF Transcript_3325/g.9630 Transcript_3325/m.9630 type:complete len:109 (-) Transcript_3325:446-772(-)|eukprot:CAMPEP_0206136006 /NCGR_PEP_ID=MMETSP1473-20131121/1244_1 /ASSEMBLY_ACC=CAM_ASM_001109 /TAXON_ID=1461547 /ORGANISM="Stichococcus sp, Strain RCC1054" /LENGTH=108 /DNA_ID=CAMNT_0053528211 /DNA_START=83 /DNA_END=409 /DNA_ORIENTATION=+
MDFLKKAAEKGKAVLSKDKGSTGTTPEGQKPAGSGIDFSDGVQASDLKAIAGGKDGINLQDGIDAKDAQGVFNAFSGNKAAAPTGAAPTGAASAAGAPPASTAPPQQL